MSYEFYKLFFLIVLIVSFNNNADGHGPSRQKVSEKIEINTNPDKVWEIVKNYMKFDWNSSVQKVTVENNDIGSERKLEFEGGKFIKQKLEKIDETKKLISWRIIETSNDVMPVNSYAAKIFVKESENGKTIVNYKAGLMHGLRTEWYKSGHKWSAQVMENGYVVSGKHFYNDGSEITHGNLINRD